MKIGIDLGGTKIRAGLIDSDGIVLKTNTLCCPSSGAKEEVIDRIIEMIDSYFDSSVDLIGVGVPAIVDADGVVSDCVNIPSWDRVELGAILTKRYGVKVKVNNDCNCFALGVKAWEPCRGYDDIVCITLGTGVGSGLILNGELYTGQNCGAGEIGGIQYKDRDFEYFCSSSFFKSKGTSGKKETDAAREGDPAALAIWEEFGANVGDLICAVLLAYDPQAIVIGGSITIAAPFFEKSMRARLAQFPYENVKNNVDIRFNPSGELLLVGSVM